MIEPPVLVALGAVTGFLIGTTGLGGGSLLTPALLLLGLPTPVLIGTDLITASITKMGASWRHHLSGTIDWKTVALLAIGSLPAGYATSLMHLKVTFLLRLLAIALILTGIAILWRWKYPPKVVKAIPIPLPLVGAAVGAIVGLTSIGSGAMLALALTFIMPHLKVSRLAGTDVAHGVLLSLVAAAGHAQRSAVDFGTVGWLLLGALPSTWLASGYAPKLSENIARPLLGTVLSIVGTVLILRSVLSS
jgi:uncharacterized protein